LLRGRDIKRYSFEFADLYIITTFPSLNIDIDSFPAVKEHLLRFGYDRLKQTGDPGARKKTNNKWFETQDSIGYWEDFYKQKIVWKIIGDQMAFFIDSNNFIVNNACYILTGESLEYLLLFLNSKIIKWYSYLTNMNKTGVGDMQVGAQNLVLFPIPIFQPDNDKEFISLLDEILTKKKYKQEINDLENIANNLVYRKYGLTQEEIDFIEF
ncbi:TaqI-like C-terminal specificity domain-containing protein, partial [Chryseobacterium scophthalmum]|uniref:TaqI-like C-terminal specificity domain-containing protein n=1 Tax=Chryseobacterium scophthalmum TaxID=59733 RepID=UPI003CFFDAEE